MKFLATKRFLLFYLALLLSIIVNAQQFPASHITVNDGLPSSFVYRVFQDSKGYMWFCTDKGIARYNGHDFKTFTLADGLPSNEIWDGLEDDEGNIWVCSYGVIPYKISNNVVSKPILLNPESYNYTVVKRIGLIKGEVVYDPTQYCTRQYHEGCKHFGSLIQVIRNDTVYDYLANYNRDSVHRHSLWTNYDSKVAISEHRYKFTENEKITHDSKSLQSNLIGENFTIKNIQNEIERDTFMNAGAKLYFKDKFIYLFNDAYYTVSKDSVLRKPLSLNFDLEAASLRVFPLKTKILFITAKGLLLTDHSFNPIKIDF